MKIVKWPILTTIKSISTGDKVKNASLQNQIFNNIYYSIP